MNIQWRNASNPSGNCVDAGLAPGQNWLAASANSNSCVEVAPAAFRSASINVTCVEAATSGEWVKGPDSFSNGNCVEAACAPVSGWENGSESNGHCVEAAPAAGWQNTCGDRECVTVADAGPVVFVRDSKEWDASTGKPNGLGTGGHILPFTRQQWDQVLASPRSVFGEMPAAVTPWGRKDGQDLLYQLDCPCEDGNSLYFTHAEVDAFCGGVKDGVFALTAAAGA